MDGKNKNDGGTKLLWYRTPAERWVEALPIGNGRLGAMVYAGANRDLLPLNEETIWAGRRIERHNPRAFEALPEVRRLIFEGKAREAEELAAQTMVSTPSELFSYQPLGDLVIEMQESRQYTKYKRWLRLDTAVADAVFEMDGVQYRKEYFSSAPDQVIAVRYECGQKGMLSLSAQLLRPEKASFEKLSADTLLMRGQDCEGGIRFAAMLKIVPEGGTFAEGQTYTQKGITSLDLTGADAVTFYIAAYTDYHCDSPLEKCVDTLSAACVKGYGRIKRDHIADHKSLFDRFELNLSGQDQCLEDDDLCTYDRLALIRSGRDDPDFYALYVNYNRYLLISSSRPGCLPSTLQGIWNPRMQAPWESDFHINVNFQINYWGAEIYNLPECHTPLFDWLETISETGSETAGRMYGAGGWVAHHCTDIWGTVSPIYGPLGIWPMGGAWTCRHFYEHYLFNPDRDFLLNRVYPIIRGSVRFMLDFLIEAPEGTPCAGCLVTNPSHSPENQFIASDGEPSWLTYAATMDIEIIRDQFDCCLKIIDILRENDPSFEREFSMEVERAARKLPPLRISAKTGGIMEWVEDYDEYEPGHRHVSHLFSCYPANDITVDGAPEFALAAEKTLRRRLSSGYDGQGWSLGWIANIWARLFKGDDAYEALSQIAKRHVLYNLFINAHGNSQVSDAQATASAVLEMLAQSHDGSIRLLSALPKAWPDGCVRGLRLRGGHELEMRWERGSLANAVIHIGGKAGLPPIIIRDHERYSFHKTENSLTIERIGASQD